MLDQDAEEALDRTPQRAMHHQRLVAVAVFADVFQFEARRQIEIELHGGQLPRAADGVDQLHVDLRAVERRFALHVLVRDAHAVERVGRARLVACCQSSADAGIIFRVRGIPFGKLHLVAREAERLHHRAGEIHAALPPRLRSGCGMQKMCASSCVKPRTRSSPCSTPERS